MTTSNPTVPMGTAIVHTTAAQSLLTDDRHECTPEEPTAELFVGPHVRQQLPRSRPTRSHPERRRSATENPKTQGRRRVGAMEVFALVVATCAPVVLWHFAGLPDHARFVSVAHAVIALVHGQLEPVGLWDAFTISAWATWAALAALTPAQVRALLAARHARSSAVAADPTDTHDAQHIHRVPSARTRGPGASAQGRRVHAGTSAICTPALALGTRSGRVVHVDLRDLAGISIEGPSAEEVARTLVVRAKGAISDLDVVTTEEVARRLWHDTPPGFVRRVESADALARELEVAQIALQRRSFADLVASPGAHGVTARTEPSLLVLAGSIPIHANGRWSTLLLTTRTAVVVFLASTPLAVGTLRVDSQRLVTDATPPLLETGLCGSVLDGTTLEEATTLVPRHSGASDVPAAVTDDELTAHTEISAVPRREPAPTVGTVIEVSSSPTPAPIVVRVLGPFAVRAFGVEITTGMRSRAKALLAYYLLHPEGARVEQAVDDLWPEIGPDQVLKQFWRALGDLRSRLERTGHTHMEVLVKTGNHYRCNEEEVACDLWDFERALDAAAQRDDETARAALRRAVDEYRGDLLGGLDFPWAEPLRVRLRSRALDAALRLAVLEESAGRLDAAVAVLERALDVDPYAEEPSCRLMTLHAARGHLDAVSATWQLLTRRLSELGVVPSAATTSLHERLVRSG